MNQLDKSPRCRHCNKKLPTDAFGNKKFPGRVCVQCQIERQPRTASAPARSTKPIRPRSKTKAREASRYAQEAAAFLKQYPHCAACAPPRAEVPTPATEIHHQRGRLGALLRDQRYWLPVCRECHKFIHDHPALSRRIKAVGFDMTLLCDVGEWNERTEDNGH